MTLEWIRFACVAICLLGGLFMLCAGVIGTFRLKFVLNRMHAAGMLDTAGLGLVTIAMVAALGWDIASLKLILCVIVQWCACPVSGHLLARMVVTAEEGHLEKYMEVQGK